MGLSHEELALVALAYVVFTAPPAAAWYGGRIRACTAWMEARLADLRRTVRDRARKALNGLLWGPDDPPDGADSTESTES